jgi:hypothetical protein
MKLFASKEKKSRPLRKMLATRPGAYCPDCTQQASVIRQILKQPRLQTKLTVGAPNDVYEQEADRVADAVMRMPDDTLARQPLEVEEEMLQSKPFDREGCCPGLQRQPEEEEELLQPKRQGGEAVEASPDLEQALAASRGDGQPLPTVSRSFFEPRMGLDLSDVRVHTGRRASDLARRVAARAFTLDSDIYFGTGQFTPKSVEGKKLLAHELTHVAQQGAANLRPRENDHAMIRRSVHGPRLQSEVSVGGPGANQGCEADHAGDRGIQRPKARIQRQEQADVAVSEEIPPDPEASPATRPAGGSPRANRCYTNPEFPDFRCLAYALKLDIDENLRNNAHRFFLTASLYPEDNERMWDTFLRYGLGVNLLQTSFGFLGADETLGTVLSYGTGIGLKSYEFFQNGVLELDVPIPLGQGVNLDLLLDINADPHNLTNVREAKAMVGISGVHNLF